MKFIKKEYSGDPIYYEEQKVIKSRRVKETFIKEYTLKLTENIKFSIIITKSKPISFDAFNKFN